MTSRHHVKLKLANALHVNVQLSHLATCEQTLYLRHIKASDIPQYCGILCRKNKC